MELKDFPYAYKRGMKMSLTDEELINIVKLRLGAFEYDSDRREFMDELTDGWCQCCGGNLNTDDGCRCGWDE